MMAGKRLRLIRSDMSAKVEVVGGAIVWRSECDWCNREATWTIDFEECGHHAVTCDECWLEYFSGEHWLGDTAECPTCTG